MVYKVVIEESHMDHDITSIIPLKVQMIENRQVFFGIICGQSAIYKQSFVQVWDVTAVPKRGKH